MDQSNAPMPRVTTGALSRWAHVCANNAWRVVGAWLVATIALIVLTIGFHGKLINEFKLPGSETQRAADLLEKKFGEQNGSTLTYVLKAKDGGRIDTPERKAAIAAITKLGKAAPKATRTTSPFDKSNLSKTGNVGFFDQTFALKSFDLSVSKLKTLQDDSRAIAEKAGMQLEFTGEAASSPPSSGSAEIFGLLAALIVLLVLFRALVPTIIPLIFAIIAVASAFMLLYLGAAITNVNNVTPIIASMIGLGVGIDYSLFIVTRFRQLMHDGLEPRAAAAGAASTAGRAVIFAGLTVAISITGLAFIGINFITIMGVGGALGVLTSVVLANTVLPAVLALLGHKVDRGGMGMPKANESRAGQQKTPIARWGRFVSNHAPAAFIVALAVTLLIAAPALGVRLGTADAGTAPKGQTTRAAYDILSDKKDGFGPGFTSPLTVVVDGDKAAADKVLAALNTLVGPGKQLAEVNAPFSNKAGDVSIINAYSNFSPQAVKTDDTVSLLRDKTVPSTGVTAYVTGQNAAFTDIGKQILSRIPIFLLFVIGVTMLVLAMAFRSLLIALKAALTTLLSAFVGFGALVFVVQLGHGLGILGLDRAGPIESFVPPIAFGILFGLSMDYEVFLMSRIREEHVHGKNTRLAVTDGIAGVGRVIVAAALIMSTVFFAFTIGDDRVPKEFGFLLGVAILTDALVVRMTLVPALLTMLGERSWAMPAWLDKLLPNLTIEPPTTAHALDGGRAAEPALGAD